MNFIDYCELPENQGWINDRLWDMKLTGFNADEIIDDVCQQATDEGIELTDKPDFDYDTYFAEWFDGLNYTGKCGAL